MDAQTWNYRLKTKSGSLKTHQTAQALNKVIIVGHPQSGYAEVEQILLNSGMNPALPALKEGLTAQQINRQLCDAHGIPSIDTLWLGESAEIKQVEVSPIWHALVLDLVRGNLDQKFWGWADSSAIFLLDFWRSVFPDVTFVLVYNHPRTALMDSRDDWEELHEEAVSPGDLLENWKTYNDALLTFYQQNQEQCLLVHGEQLKKSPSRILTQMKAISGQTMPSHSDIDELSNNTNGTNGFHAKFSETPAPIRLSLFARQKAHDSLMPYGFDDAANPLEMYLANALLNHYPTVKSIYEKLQETALVAHREKLNSEIGINMVWNTYHEMLTANYKLTGENLRVQQEMAASRKELANTRRQIDEKQIENGRLWQKRQQLEEELTCRKSEINQLQNELAALQNTKHMSLAHSNEIEALRSQISNLLQDVSQKRTQLEQTQKKQREVEQDLELENQLLLKQLHLVQEELENYFIENKNKEVQLSSEAKRHKETCQQLQTEIDTLRANQKPVFTGAKQRQQNELVYQIGYTLVQLNRSFIKWKLLFYPLFIRKFLKNYVCESQQTEQWLPPLTEYADYQEAVKAQAHLSYQLGITWQKHRRRFGAYFLTPWALLGAYSKWKQKRNSTRLLSHEVEKE